MSSGNVARPSGGARDGGRGSAANLTHSREPGRPLHNLPVELTSFVGREKEIAEVKELLAGDTRLLTLTGPGGCGKTRLALAVANNVAGDFGGGAWWIGLAPLSDPGLVPQAVASTLGVREVPGRSLTEALVGRLELREILLLLDNCEHLVESCAALADTLLRACPNLRVLATSREALGVSGETVWPVPSLSFPDSPRHPYDPGSLGRYGAVRLFVERAGAVVSGFELAEGNASAVARLCRRLEGMPLAVELAAARVSVLSAEQILERLEDPLKLLTHGGRTADPRHRTLRETLAWSYDLLGEQERQLFGRLSVFAGGWALAAAEAVGAGGGIEEGDVLDLLSQLVDKSMVVAWERDGEVRYRLLEMVRQYGRERLDESGEAATIRMRHARCFLAWAEEVYPKINSADRRLWLGRLEVEHDNFRAALRWAGETGEAETELRLAGALWRFWFNRGYWSEGRGWLEEALTAERRADGTAAWAKALYGAGVLAWAMGDHAAAYSRLEESVELWRELEDDTSLAHALRHLSLEVLYRGDHALARSQAEESEALFRREGEDTFGLTTSLAALGNVAMTQEDYAAARSALEESVAISRKSGDAWGLAMPLTDLGATVFRQDDHEQAEELLKESLTVLRGLGERWFITRSLEFLAAVVSVRGDHERGARLFGAGEALRETLGASVLPYYRLDYDRGVAAARAPGWTRRASLRRGPKEGR